MLGGAHCKALLLKRSFDVETYEMTSSYKLRWDGPKDDEPPTDLLRAAMTLVGFVSADLQMEEAGD